MWNRKSVLPDVLSKLGIDAEMVSDGIMDSDRHKKPIISSQSSIPLVGTYVVQPTTFVYRYYLEDIKVFIKNKSGKVPKPEYFHHEL